MNDIARAAHLAGLSALSLLLGAAVLADPSAIVGDGSRLDPAQGAPSGATVLAEPIGTILAADRNAPPT